MTYPNSLQDLEQQLQYQLELLGLPEPSWLPASNYQGQNIYDVAIVGAGMAGLSVAASLVLKGINNIIIFDQAPANLEGPWARFARMQTLRSPKNLAGPALGIPALTFQAWYSAQYGLEAWSSLDRIPRLIWHSYLQWYKRVLALKVFNQQQLSAITTLSLAQEERPLAQLTTCSNNSSSKTLARHVVLATGMNGFGGINIPDWVQELPKNYWQHTNEDIDMHSLQGKHIAIIGGRDSALDAAATTLEHQAKAVTLCIRAAGFTQVNYSKAITNSGHWLGFTEISTQQKAQLLGFLASRPTPPARGTVARLKQLDNLEIRLGLNIEKATINQRQIELISNQGLIEADFIILATGYTNKPGLRPEFKNILPYIDFYKAHELGYNLPAQELTIPRLNADFSFKEKTPGSYPLLNNIYCFNPAALYSVGKISSDIPAISFGAQKLTAGITAKLYAANFNHQFNNITTYSQQEISDTDLDFLMSKANYADNTSLIS